MNHINGTHHTITCPVLAFSSHIPRLAGHRGSTFFRQRPKHTINIQTTSYPKEYRCYSVSVFRVAEVEEKGPSSLEIQRLVDFLHEHLPCIFDDKGIDPTIFDQSVKFTDPITEYDSLSGFLFNITMLRWFFSPKLHLHWTKQTGPYEITARWTALMKSTILPWKTELVLTGTSVMDINPKTKRICKHRDYWDSVKNNDFFSLEGLLDVMKQLHTYALKWEMPKYQILKRTADYEVRKYETFILEEKLSNLRDTDPVTSLAASEHEIIGLRKMIGGVAAVLKFGGNATEETTREKEKMLRNILIRDDLKPEDGFLFARSNDPDPTWSFNFIMRNEVLIWLEEFSLD